MGNIDLACKTSFKVLTTQQENRVYEGMVGFGSVKCGDYRTYMYFDLSPIPDYIQVNKATLVLFNKPAYQGGMTMGSYCMTALREYVNKNVLYYYLPKEDRLVTHTATLNTCQPVFEIDFTDMMRMWVDQTLENKGFVIEGVGYQPLITCNGQIEEEPSLFPFLRVLYQPKSPLLPPINTPTIKLQSKGEISV